MIESLSISKVATYPEKPEVMNGLKSLNFIFGSNGTGKTTIGRVITDPSVFPGCSVTWKGNKPLQSLVYNSEFVERNFKLAENFKGVFTLGEEQIGTLEKITQLKLERDALTKKIEAWNATLKGVDGKEGKRKDLSNLDSNFKKKCWDQKVKHDSKFQKAFEGFRNNAEKFKDSLLENTANTSALRSLNELEKKAETVFGQAPVAEHLVPTIDSESLLAHEANVILKKKAIGKTDVDIAAMINKLGNSDWIKEGQAYFDENGNVCPFCQQATKESFAKSLNDYFDEAFLRDTMAINELATDYQTDAARIQYQLGLIIGTNCKFLDVAKLKEEKELLDSKLMINSQRIAAKKKESSQSIELESISNVVSAIRALISSANTLITEHNRMVRNLESERDTLTAQVWRLVVEEIKSDIATYQSERVSLEKAINGLGEEIKKSTEALNGKMTAIRELERMTTSVRPTVDAINQLLLSFGFRGFCIDHIGGTTSYKLVREDGTEAMRSLSEGEKTFVTFLYFFQLIKGSDTESGISNDRVVVFDDPVSSLDSDILFIVGSLIKGLFDEVRAKTGHIKQIFVLTHNVYFHKEVTFHPNRPKKKVNGDESFWMVRKSDRFTKIEPHESNPIKTSYELLWAELRRSDRSNLTIQNTLRRILENYFKILGGVDPDTICAKFEGREKFICKSLFSWVNDGSHSAHDDIFVSDGASVETYLQVFEGIFDKLNHGAHYRMMMREDELAHVTA